MKLGSIFKKKDKKSKEEEAGRDAQHDVRSGAIDLGGDDFDAAAYQDALAHAVPDGVDIDTKVKMLDNDFYYLVKIENKTGEIMGDVNVAVTAEKPVVKCPKPRQSVKFIDPGKKNVFKFPMHPTMVCGKTSIQGLVRYFDFKDKDQTEFLLPEYELGITCPDILEKKVDEEVWRITMSKLEVFEVETDEIDFEPQQVFQHLSKISEKIGFYGLKPVVAPSIYRAIGKFFGLDAVKDPYCIEIQVIGQGKKSRLLLRCWAPTNTAAMGIAFKIIGKSNKRLELKSRIAKKSKEGK